MHCSAAANKMFKKHIKVKNDSENCINNTINMYVTTHLLNKNWINLQKIIKYK